MADAVTEGRKDKFEKPGNNKSIAGLKRRETSPAHPSHGARVTETSNGLFVCSKPNCIFMCNWFTASDQ